MIYSLSRIGAGTLLPPRFAWRVTAGTRLRACLASGADAREVEDVVGGLGEDRICEVVLRCREAVEVLRAVRRPARPDEQRDDRLVLEEHRRRLLEQLLLRTRAEGRAPLIDERRRARIEEV